MRCRRARGRHLLGRAVRLGSGSAQRLVGIAEMAGWQFYDDAEWMANAYREGVNSAWREHDKQAEGK